MCIGLQRFILKERGTQTFRDGSGTTHRPNDKTPRDKLVQRDTGPIFGYR